MTINARGQLFPKNSFRVAVSIAVILARRMTLLRGGCYVVAQLIGAIAGAGMAKIALPDAIQGNLGQPVLVNGASDGAAFLMEVNIPL